MAKDLTSEEERLREACLHFAKTKKLTLFDVRSHVFEDLAPVYFEERQKRLEPEDKERWMEDRENYRQYKDNIVLKTCIAKYWAQAKRLNYDYDDSLFSTCIFEILSQKFFPEKNCTTKRNDRYPHEYVIVAGDSEEYRGDVMNSWGTTINRFFQMFSDEYLDEKNKNDYSYTFLSKPSIYKKGCSLPPYLTDFMEVVYTIGNFLPVPERFNKERSAPTKDYWDLTLLSIYEYYRGNGAETKLAELFKEDAIRRWLDSFDGWDDFVIRNFQGPFVNKCGCHFGCPRELWDGHFTGALLPETPEQFEQFFVNAKARILARGKLMADALKAQLEED